jgi:hypothetical protein
MTCWPDIRSAFEDSVTFKYMLIAFCAILALVCLCIHSIYLVYTSFTCLMLMEHEQAVRESLGVPEHSVVGGAAENDTGLM